MVVSAIVSLLAGLLAQASRPVEVVELTGQEFGKIVVVLGAGLGAALAAARVGLVVVSRALPQFGRFMESGRVERAGRAETAEIDAQLRVAAGEASRVTRELREFVMKLPCSEHGDRLSNLQGSVEMFIAESRDARRAFIEDNQVFRREVREDIRSLIDAIRVAR